MYEYDISEHMKVFILSENVSPTQPKWICDILKDEFTKNCTSIVSDIEVVSSPNNADVIWLLSAWRYTQLDLSLLQNKFVVTTIHNIDFDKYDTDATMYKTIDSFTNKYHVLCNKVRKDLKKITSKPQDTLNRIR